MANFFPPEPIFPLGIDSDNTLFKVYNTSTSFLAANNQAWADEMEIIPVGPDDLEVWANNGFATISGELFYYDTVEKDINDKIFKFKRLSRNLAGSHTQYNAAGTDVRGFVLADHHNQLLDAILQIEKAIGICTDEQKNACPTDDDSLDCKIARLLDENTCQDDFGCPDIDFDFKILSKDPCNGTNTSFNITITGSFTNYRLDFGDGTFTTQQQTGTHLYAPNAEIDPFVSVTSASCQLIQTPINRTNPDEPKQPLTPDPFIIPIQEIPEFPTITIPDIAVPSTTLEFPQFIQTCTPTNGGINNISITPAIPPIISIIPPFAIPSIISIAPFPAISFADAGLPNPILFGPNPLPTQIEFGTPPTIQFGPPPIIQFGDPPIIQFADPPTIQVTFESPPSLTVKFDTPPEISMNWGTPPACNCTVSVQCCSGSGGGGSSTTSMAFGLTSVPFKSASSFLDDDFLDSFADKVQVEAVSNIGIPSEISLIVPHIPDINITHNIPTSIAIETPVFQPIQVVHNIPKDINLVTDITEFKLNVENMPKTIKIDTEGVSLKVEMPQFDKLQIDTSGLEKGIEVKGIPTTIEVVHNLPQKMILDLSDELKNFKIPLVFEGGAIPMKFTNANIIDDDGKACFRLVPCDPK